MHLIWRRYSRSGSAPSWFYSVIACGFAGLALWALTQADWIVAAIALVMIPVTAAGSRMMRRLSNAVTISRRNIESQEDSTHE